MKGWYPDKVETVKLKADEVRRIGASQAADYLFQQEQGRRPGSSSTSSSPAESERDFRKYHYFGSPEEAFAWLGGKETGRRGVCDPAEWVTK